MVVERQLGWMCMVLARNNQANQVLITSYSPDLCCLPKLSQARPALLSMNLGHLLVVVAVAFFLVASYAVLLSAFYPLPSIPVSKTRSRRDTLLIIACPAPQHLRGRYALQVPGHTPHPNRFLLRNRKLGWMAVLPKLMNT